MSSNIRVYQGMVVNDDTAVQLYNTLADREGKGRVPEDDQEEFLVMRAFPDTFNSWSSDLKLVCNEKSWVIGFLVKCEEFDRYEEELTSFDPEKLRSKEDFVSAAKDLGWGVTNPKLMIFIEYSNCSYTH